MKCRCHNTHTGPVHTMNKIHYLAYGSNLHPVRLQRRIPSAVLVGSTEMVHSRIVFHKRGQDGSGKCMLLLDPAGHQSTYGALYSMDAAELSMLDEIEGIDQGYIWQELQCMVNGVSYAAFTYIAQTYAIDPQLKPFHWYKALVLAGVRYHQFPKKYMSLFEVVDSIEDLDEERRSINHELLAMIGHH